MGEGVLSLFLFSLSFSPWIMVRPGRGSNESAFRTRAVIVCSKDFVLIEMLKEQTLGFARDTSS